MIELFKVKLKRTWLICQIDADWMGITVIPPGNFRTSKEDGCPKMEAVRDRLDCWRTSSMRDDLRTLRAMGFITASSGFGRTPKATYVEFDEVNGRMPMMETC